MNNPYKSIEKNKQSNRQMGKGKKKAIHIKVNPMAFKHMKLSLVIKRM